MGTKKDPLDEHNTSANKKWWIPWVAIGLAVFSLIISIWSVTLSNVRINNVDLEFSYDKLGTISGIILSAVALVISLYFIILGIGANSIRREINNDAEKAKSTVEEINEAVRNAQSDIINDSEKSRKSISVIVTYNLYSELIEMTQLLYGSFINDSGCSLIHYSDCSKTVKQRIQMSKRIIELKLAQTRNVCNVQNLDIEDKIQDIMVSSINIIKDLGTEEDDLRRLEEVRRNTKNKLIEYTAKEAYDTLDKKLHPKE